jgi:hypothetical protein
MERIDEYKEVNLSDLVGGHVLTGVEMGRAKYKARYSDYDESNYIKFCLDGVNYMCMEDPEDGYRSSMDGVFVSDEPCSTVIPPPSVLAVMNMQDGSEILNLIDRETLETVLSVGTDRTDDYYPLSISYWNPAGLVWNQ